MNSFKIFTIGTFILLTTICTAQKIVISPENIESSGLDYVKIIGQDDEGFYLLSSNLSFYLQKDRIGLKSRKYQLSYFGFDLKPRWTKLLSSHPESANIENIGFFEDKPFVLQSNWSKSENKLQLFLDVYDSKGNLNIQAKNIASISTNRPSNFEKPRSFLSTSKNILGIYLKEDKETFQTIHFVSIDSAYSAKNTATADLASTDRDLDISDLALSNENELLILTKLTTKDPNSSKKQIRIFSLFLLPPAGTKFKEFKINDSGKNMSEAALAIDKVNRKAVVTGLYSEKESFAGAGILFAILKLDSPDELKIHLSPVTGDNQNKLVGGRNNGNGISLFNYPVQKVILRKNGGAVIIAEAAYLSEYQYYDYFTQSFSRRVEYHFDNIVVFAITPDGEIEFTNVVSKEQTSMDDEGLYSSYTSALTTDELILIYNNDIGRNNEIVCYRMNSSGQISSKKLSRLGENISILPRSGRQVDISTIVAPAYYKKKLYLVKIDLEE